MEYDKENRAQLTILVDMDDTLEHLLPAWLSWLNDTYLCNVTEEDIHSWNLCEAYPELTPEQVYGPLHNDMFWYDVKPYAAAGEVLRQFLQDGHRVFIVTNTHFRTLRTKMERVLFRYFPFLDWDQVIVCSKKQMIRGDILIDDGPHNLVGGDYIKLMMDQPHNRGLDAAWLAENGVTRVYSWVQIAQIVDHIARTKGNDKKA